MRQAHLALVVGLTLTGCSSGGADRAAPSPTPTVARTTAPPVQGPSAVPSGAFLSTADLGAGWTTTTAAAPPCAPSFARMAIRSVGLAESRGTLTETLATEVDIASAVTAWGRSLGECGYAVRDDALGDAALSARLKEDAVIVTGTDGVLVVLHAHGSLAAASDELDGWADLALGTSCVAAPDGCH